MSARSYDVSFDVSGLASSVYFYSLEARGVNGIIFDSIKKMIVI
jgi:hypothetical protein